MAILADVKLFLVFMIAVVHLTKNAAGLPRSCDPYERCKTTQLGKKVPNPVDCNSYFICMEDANGNRIPSDAPIKCPANSTFSDSIQYYIDPNCRYLKPCEKSCMNMCNGECVDYHHERIADMNDCSAFYTCLPGNKKVKTKCPPEAPYFDGVNCRKSKYSCCSCCDECTTFCHKENTQVFDPLDCKSFYICLGKGEYPSEKNRHQCEVGKYFDRSKGRCEDEDPLNPCTPACKNETMFNKTKNEHLP